LLSAEEAGKSGRIPVAVEVIRRMNALANREFLLMAGVTGPLTLAAQLTQLEHKESLRSEDLSEAAQELAASVVTQMAITLLDAGADTIIIQEEIVPALSAASCETWENLLAPTINVIRFYEALPMLLFSGVPSADENWGLIFRQKWNCVNCVPADVIALRRREELHAIEGTAFGIALSLEAFRLKEADDKCTSRNIQTWNSDPRFSIVTTAGDVPIATDMKHLIKVFEGVPRGA
jgi:hypothetical protein